MTRRNVAKRTVSKSIRNASTERGGYSVYLATVRMFVVGSRMKREITLGEAERKSSAAGFAGKSRRYPIGAELIAPNQAHFRVWAPKAQDVDLVLEESAKKEAMRTFHPLEREDNGYFSGVANVGAGALYRFRVNQAEHFHPDPASRFQPHGPHGSSCVVDPTQFKWTDSEWRGVQMKGQIIYEMHVGIFTKEGTWRAASEQLAELARIGITVVEMMPIADFPGNFGWGYDGVDLFAPFHLYGFRFDATDAIHDKSDEYIIGAVGRAARKAAAPRSIILIAENERQVAKLIRPRSESGDDLDAVWNDDFHHSAVVALTGRREAYYSDFLGTPQEFISAAKYGFLFQGQPYFWQVAPRGTPAFGSPPHAFVAFIETNDQVSNTAAGERLRFQSSPGRYRAMTALLLLGPWTPLLFQGQEFGASTPFIFFTDVGDGQMREAIRKGRFGFLAQFPSLATKEVQERLPVPSDPTSFVSCKLDFSERQKNQELYDLHVDLMRLRREDSRFREQRTNGVDGAVLGPASFLLRYFSEDNRDDRLLVVNFGESRELNPIPEPLLAPPLGLEWETIWSSESARYGGSGTATVATQDNWTLPAEATVALRLVPEKEPRKQPKPRKWG